MLSTLFRRALSQSWPNTSNKTMAKYFYKFNGKKAPENIKNN